MQDDLRSLRFLLAQAERERDDALGALMKAERAERAAVDQAEQLVVYRREYEQRWSAEFCRDGKIELVRCYQGFMERLSQAVDQQARIAAHAVLQAERATAQVQGHEMRAAALKKLLERRTREALLVGTQREQRQSDDQAARAAWARMNAARPPVTQL
jgi:flagellar FliJ protein